MFGEKFDLIVIGGGVVGSSAAYHAAKRGISTLLLEQFPLGHTRGSSHGKSRIIRHAYGEWWQYANMMPDAYSQWRHLEKISGTKLLHTTGGVLLGNDAMSVTANTRCLKHFNVRHEPLDNAGIKSRFPQFTVDENYTAVIEPDMGVLNPDLCVRVLQDQFKHLGGVIHDYSQVTSLESINSSLVYVHTSSTLVHVASRVIIAGGAWVNKLLATTGIQIQIQPEHVHVFYWPEKYKGSFNNNIAMLATDKRPIYLIPSLEYPGLTKFLIHGGHPTDPECRTSGDNKSMTLLKDKQFLQDKIRALIPGLSDEPAIIETCMYTVTPDGHFVVDKHPIKSNIVIGAGFSGHGFKMAPVVGSILVDLATGIQPKYDISSMNINRVLENTASKL